MEEEQKSELFVFEKKSPNSKTSAAARSGRLSQVVVSDKRQEMLIQTDEAFVDPVKYTLHDEPFRQS